MKTTEYIEQIRTLEKAIKTARAKIAHCNETIERSKRKMRDLDLSIQSFDVYNAKLIIKEFCKSHDCTNCPFFDRNPFVKNDCSFYKTLPRNWGEINE